MKKQEFVSSHYQDEAGKHYVEYYLADTSHAGYTSNMKFFKPMLKPTDTILDFGCGNGGLLHLLSDHVARAEGLEAIRTQRRLHVRWA